MASHLRPILAVSAAPGAHHRVEAWARCLAGRLGAPVVRLVRRAPTPAEVVDLANKRDAGILVLDAVFARASGAAGAAALHLALRAPCPTLVLHPWHGEPGGGVRTVVAGIDFSAASVAAARFATLRLAGDTAGVRLLLVHACPDEPVRRRRMSELRAERVAAAEARLRPLAGALRRCGFAVETRASVADPATLVTAVAQAEGADLLTLGHRAGPETGAPPGPAAYRTVRNAPCPVLHVVAP